MLAQSNEYLREAVSGVRQLTEDEKIRQQCQAREDFAYWERMKTLKHQRELQERDEVIQNLSQEQNNTLQILHQKEELIQQKEDQLAAALAKIAELEAKQNKPLYSAKESGSFLGGI